MDEAVLALEARLAALEARLERVVMAPAPRDDQVEEASPPLCTLAEGMREQARKVRAAAERLSLLLSSLQL